MANEIENAGEKDCFAIMPIADVDGYRKAIFGMSTKTLSSQVAQQQASRQSGPMKLKLRTLFTSISFAS